MIIVFNTFQDAQACIDKIELSMVNDLGRHDAWDEVKFNEAQNKYWIYSPRRKWPNDADGMLLGCVYESEIEMPEDWLGEE